MNAQGKIVDWRKVFADKKVLPAEEVLNYFSKIGKRGDFYEAVELAAKVDDSYLMGSTADQNKAKAKVIEIKRRLIESNPMDDVRIMENGMVWSVCCEDMKKAVLNGDVHPIIGYESEPPFGVQCVPSMAVTSPYILDRMLNTVNGEYEDGYFQVAFECPFCRAEIYDRGVNRDGVCPDDLREEL